MSGPAPGQLELVREFVNSVDLESGKDRLASPPELVGWLAERELLAAGTRAGAEDLVRALELREALRALLLANNEGDRDEQATALIDAAAERAGLRLRFEPSGEAALKPSSPGVDGALGRLLAIVAESMREGSWRRLKACRNDSCRWAFYDASKNRSGAWCSMAVCGNRAKVRAFRERQAG
jgi:predicted RNA-binding Zn ribbon-like protein